MPGCQLITHILQFVVAALRRSFARNLNDRKVLEKSCSFYSEEHPLRLKTTFLYTWMPRTIYYTHNFPDFSPVDLSQTGRTCQ